MRQVKVVTVLGTRPEIIRLSRVLALLDTYTDHTLVHTGQNYDVKLNDIFFEDLGVRAPDVVLGTDTRSLGAFLGSVLTEIEGVLRERKPDALLVLGDTNSSIAALLARRMHITVYHMEAGNRCFDANVPEEVNRRMIDHISDFNLVYTEHARRNLLREGFEPRRIYLTGSPLGEVFTHYHDRILSSTVLDRLQLTSGGYFLVSVHREENVDEPDRLTAIVHALEELNRHSGLPVIVSTHPRTRLRLGRDMAEVPTTGVSFMEPFGFRDYNQLQLHARCVLSDSGSVSEESAILGFPAVTIRNSMERPESMDAGSIALTGLDADVILQAVTMAVDLWQRGTRAPLPQEYAVQNCSARVANLIVGTARLNAVWSGYPTHDRSVPVA